MNKRLVKDIARLIEGLHVPVSIGVPLGTAREAYSNIRDQIHDFGYSSSSEIEELLERALATDGGGPTQ